MTKPKSIPFDIVQRYSGFRDAGMTEGCAADAVDLGGKASSLEYWRRRCLSKSCLWSLERTELLVRIYATTRNDICLTAVNALPGKPVSTDHLFTKAKYCGLKKTTNVARKPYPKVIQFSASGVEQMRELRASGASMAAIARVFGVSRNVIERRLREPIERVVVQHAPVALPLPALRVQATIDEARVWASSYTRNRDLCIATINAIRRRVGEPEFELVVAVDGVGARAWGSDHELPDDAALATINSKRRSLRLPAFVCVDRDRLVRFRASDHVTVSVSCERAIT